MSSNDSKLHVFDDTNKIWRKAIATSTGQLKCETTVDKTGLATDTLQTAGNASLSSIDSKIVACDTGAVVVSSVSGTVAVSGNVTEINSASILADTNGINNKIIVCDTGNVTVGSSVLPSGAATSALQTTANGSLASIDGKITACDTGSVTVAASALPSGAATSALQTAGNASLSSIDGKITACDTGSVTVAASALPSGAATSALQTTGNASLSSMDGKMRSGADHTLSTATNNLQQVAVYGLDNNSDFHMLHLNNTGDLNVEISEFAKGQAVMASSFPVVISSDQSTLNVKQQEVRNLGSYENIASNITLAAGASSSSVDVSSMSKGNLFYEDSTTTSNDPIEIEASVNSGTNWFKYTNIYPYEETSGSGLRHARETGIRLQGITNIRIKNGSGTISNTNVRCTIVGSP